jgi:hypothetical protein
VQSILLELKSYARGWLGYYCIADMKETMARLVKWTRRRIRMYIWKQWKRGRTRFDRLQSLGVNSERAWQWANTRKGYWRTAGSQIGSSTTNSDKKLSSQWYVDAA